MGKKIIGCIRNALAVCLKSLTPHYMEHYIEFTILQGCPNTQMELLILSVALSQVMISQSIKHLTPLSVNVPEERVNNLQSFYLLISHNEFFCVCIF